MSILHKNIITSNLLHKRTKQDAINFLGKSLQRSIKKCIYVFSIKITKENNALLNEQCNIHIQNSKFNLFPFGILNTLLFLIYIFLFIYLYVFCHISLKKTI